MRWVYYCIAWNNTESGTMTLEYPSTIASIFIGYKSESETINWKSEASCNTLLTFPSAHVHHVTCMLRENSWYFKLVGGLETRKIKQHSAHSLHL